MMGLWWAAAASAATCAQDTVLYDAGVVLLELRWEKPGETIALRCRDPQRRKLEPPELVVAAKPGREGWIEGDTLQATSDKEKKAQYTGDIDQYLGKVVKLPSNELFSTANLLAFDCLNAWAQWVKVVAPSCGLDGLQGAEVSDSDAGKVVQTTQAFQSEVMGSGSESREQLQTTWVIGEDGWPVELRQVHQRDGKVIEEQLLKRAIDLEAEPTAPAATPAPAPEAAAPSADGG